MLKIDSGLCLLCGQCVDSCPFGALELSADGAKVNILDGCRACGACENACPAGAITLQKTESGGSAALSPAECSGFLVFLQAERGGLLPVSYELLGAALRLRDGVSPKQGVCAVLIGSGVLGCAKGLFGFDLDCVYVFDDPCFTDFRADAFAAAVCACVRANKPAVLLFGATNEGRSVAPLVAVSFKTGLTADCTALFMNADGLLAQVRPAFGGNVMARIVTKSARPQMVTVRSGVMPPAFPFGSNTLKIVRMEAPASALESPVRVLLREDTAESGGIAEARVILAVGNGVIKKEDLAFFEDCAKRLGAVLASSRALVEKGWMPISRQIGLSGTAVSPDLLILCGISGSVQFRAGIGGAKRVIAINADQDAPIFAASHRYAVGDMYELLPMIIEELHKA